MINFFEEISKAQLSGNQELTDYRDAVSKATTDMKTIQLRHNIILERFVSTYDPTRLDNNKFTEEQKIAIFRNGKGKCQSCGSDLSYGNSHTHYHHKKMHIKGGKTEIKNGLLLCQKCHQTKFHH